MGGSFAPERPPSWPPMKKSGGFTSGPISGWTKMEESDGDPAKASNEASAEADPYSVAPAGGKSAADVEGGVARPPKPGGGGEPPARRGSDRGSGRAGADAR